MNYKYWTYGKGGLAHYSNSQIITKLKAIWFCLKYNKISYVETPTGESNNSHKNIKTYHLVKLRKLVLGLRFIFYLPTFIVATFIMSITWFIERDFNLKKELLHFFKWQIKRHDFTTFFWNLCFTIILLILVGCLK